MSGSQIIFRQGPSIVVVLAVVALIAVGIVVVARVGPGREPQSAAAEISTTPAPTCTLESATAELDDYADWSVTGHDYFEHTEWFAIADGWPEEDSERIEWFGYTADDAACGLLRIIKAVETRRAR